VARNDGRGRGEGKGEGKRERIRERETIGARERTGKGACVHAPAFNVYATIINERNGGNQTVNGIKEREGRDERERLFCMIEINLVIVNTVPGNATRT
jgi:hypothetical protein